MKILLINDNSAHPNWGAQATPHALKRILRRSMPGCEVVQLPWDWLRRGYRRVTVPFLRHSLIENRAWGRLRPLVTRVSRAERFYPEIADDFDYFADEWVAGGGGPDAAEFLSLARAADVVLYNGENSIYRNTTEGCHGLFLLWVAATRLGIPSALVNHTCDLNHVRPIMNAMVRKVGSAIDLVAAREPRSLRALHDLGVANAILVPDVVFAEDPGEISTVDFDRWSADVGLRGQPYFCFSASGLPMSAPRSDWQGATAELVNALRQLGHRPVLIARDPHCQFLEQVAGLTGGLYFGPEHHFSELWPLFRHAGFSVTGHFHYMIIGASVGCPFIPFANNNHKVQGVCELLQWPRTTPFDATWLESCRSEIVDEARSLLSDRERISSTLAGRASELRVQSRTLGDRLRDLAVARLDGSMREKGIAR